MKVRPGGGYKAWVTAGFNIFGAFGEDGDHWLTYSKESDGFDTGAGRSRQVDRHLQGREEVRQGTVLGICAAGWLHGRIARRREPVAQR
ncbi:hypothetical protein MASR1M65_03920 [Saprospiraceae bacterium]